MEQVALLQVLIGSALLLLVPGSAAAAVFNIPNGDVAALKAALTTAAANHQSDAINLAANGTYTLTTVDNTTNGENDNVMIAGFIVLNGNQKVIVRAIGPSLPVSGALQDPVLELHDQDGNVTLNDNWRTGGQQAQIIATTVPSGDDRESAIVGTLAPGNYTAIVRGANNTSGIALVEVFALQQQVSPLQQTAAPLHIPAPSRTTEPVISLVVAAVSYRWPVSNYALLS